MLKIDNKHSHIDLSATYRDCLGLSSMIGVARDQPCSRNKHGAVPANLPTTSRPGLRPRQNPWMSQSPWAFQFSIKANLAQHTTGLKPLDREGERVELADASTRPNISESVMGSKIHIIFIISQQIGTDMPCLITHSTLQFIYNPMSIVSAFILMSNLQPTPETATFLRGSRCWGAAGVRVHAYHPRF